MLCRTGTSYISALMYSMLPNDPPAVWGTNSVLGVLTGQRAVKFLQFPALFGAGLGRANNGKVAQLVRAQHS